MWIKRWFGLGLCVIGMAVSVAQAETVWQPVAEEVISHLQAAETASGEGKSDDARRQVMQGYFGVFESRKMEAAMRTRLGSGKTYQVERQFADLRKAIKQGAEQAVIHSRVEKLSADLREAAAALDKAGVPAGVFEVNH